MKNSFRCYSQFKWSCCTKKSLNSVGTEVHFDILACELQLQMHFFFCENNFFGGISKRNLQKFRNSIYTNNVYFRCITAFFKTAILKKLLNIMVAKVGLSCFRMCINMKNPGFS